MAKNKEVVIDAGTSLLVETLEQRWKIYRSELKRCQQEPSEEAIHDFRVASRRLLALVDMLRAVSPHPRLQKLRRTFKNQLDNLDDLRDTQVMLGKVWETLEELPELALFQKYLIKREKRLLRSSVKAIKSYKSANIRKRIDLTRKALLKGKDRNIQGEVLIQIVDDAYKTALRRFNQIEPDQFASIHRFRIAFKKFRYMIEIIHSIVPNFPEDNFKGMHDYQGIMGDIQDLEIFVSVLDNFVSKDTAYDFISVRKFYLQRRTETVQNFTENIQLFNTFWRSTSEAPFPWEIKRRRKKSTSARKTVEISQASEEIASSEQAEAETEAET